MSDERRSDWLDRLALLLSLCLVVANVATTARWAAVPGALRGWRWPYVIATVVIIALPARRAGRPLHVLPVWLPRVICGFGVVLLAALFLFNWLPPGTWTWVPILDDWPPRFSSTVEGLALLRHGAFAGWQWNLLGGYPTATDITQSLTLVSALPMLLFGDRIGFHLTHFILVMALPALVFVDLRRAETRSATLVATGLVAISACGLSFSLMRSGDTNSLAGMVGVMAVLSASHRLRSRGAYGHTMLLAALTATIYSHIGFFVYACGLLLVEAAYYRSWASAARATVLGTLALAASLPLTFELLRYSDQFNFNNVMYVKPPHVAWLSMARSIGYNVQILLSPARWFNNVPFMLGPLILLAAVVRRGRVGFYAWAVVFVIGLGLLNVPQAGYFFARPGQLLMVCAPIALTWFITERTRTTWQAGALVVLVLLTTTIVDARVPHVASVAEFVPGVVSRVRAARGAMVLLENNPHRDVDASLERVSEKSLYGDHYESLIPAETGQRLYAGYWDGWQWTPYRGDALEGGAWRGHMLTTADHDAFLAELRRWGVRDLMVWSETAKQVLGTWPELAPIWADGPWREFELGDAAADVRSVATDHGAGDLIARSPLGATVSLVDVQAGDRVAVRTHFHPAWQVWASGHPLATSDLDGQLSFLAPTAGRYEVALVYPARRSLLWLALAVFAAVWMYDRRRPLRPRPSTL